ncbi:hypothetical protein AF332_14345 [Sporosarcina globispora]|uniref:Uncharacterized protein n=1 Tax=Sporosarcina globispora TaxID=1459 RepID=A0A0M0GEH3_SPOGL|nr:hypothetical protein AF332_14345 [Sporosarcina globispora]
MRMRRFLGIKPSTILTRLGNAAVLAVALAAFSFSASTALTVLTVSDALTVFTAADAVADAVADGVVGAAEGNRIINKDIFIKKPTGPSKRKSLQLYAGAFLLKGDI